MLTEHVAIRLKGLTLIPNRVRKRCSLMKFQYPTSRRTCPDGAPARFLNNALVGHFTIVGDLHDILSKRAYLEIWKWDSGIDWLSWYGQRITSPINATGSTKLKKILSKNLLHPDEIESCLFPPQVLFKTL